MQIPDRCTIHRLNLLDPERAADDPALAALLRDGWTVISDIPVANEGDPHVLLFLAPPRPHEGDRTTRTLSVAGLALAAVGVGLWVASWLSGAL